MSCHSCGPEAAERRMAKRLGKEMAKKIIITQRSRLAKKLGLKKEQEICCSMMKNYYLKKGYVKIRASNPMTPNRMFFILEVRGSETNIILSYCLGCGKYIYPAPEKKIERPEKNEG